MITEGKIILIVKSYTQEDILPIADLKLFVFKRDSSLTPTLTDSELILYRNTCIERIEDIIKTSIVKSDYRLELHGFHNFTNNYSNSRGFIIKKPYVKEISSIGYLINNVLTNLDNDIFYSEIKNHSYVFRKSDLDFPKIDSNSSFQAKPGSVQVLFKSGLFDNVASVSSSLKEAIVDYVIEKYNGCGENDLITNLKNAINQYAYIHYSDWFELDI